MRPRVSIRAWLAVALASTAGCGAASRGARAPAPGAAAAVVRVRSNMLRVDYAGSERCAGCHDDVYREWQSSPMHLMTRLPDTAHIRAPFDGATFHFKADTARLTQQGGARFVDLESPTDGNHRYRVTRVIGGRYREDFVGVEVDGSRGGAGTLSGSPDAWTELGSAERSPSRGGAGTLSGSPSKIPELLLPVSYVFETRSFRLKGYSVLATERPGLRAGGVWSETCIFCHNTTPYFDSTWGALAGPGAPSYQGEVVDRLLPPDRRVELVIAPGGGAALADAVGAEVRVAGGAAPAASDLRAALVHGIRELRARFGARDFVELGIGCESCHGGSREHAADPRVRPDFAPHTAFLDTRAADGREITRAERINRTCARCHQVLFSRYPFTWEGGRRRGDDPGGSTITSGEGRDFLLGGCARQMSCVDCHDPHAEDRRADLDRLGTVAGNTVCVRCHGRYAAPAALAAHAHHDPSGVGASCVGCHMPRKNMGLGYALTRYHRIGLPDDPARVERDRPLECALCHADKTVEDLTATMEKWWGRRYDRAALADLYGSLQARPLVATLARGKAHEQAAALAALAGARVTEAVPAVARQLVNPFPLVRYYARRALEALRGDACAVDLDRSTADIAAAVRACVPAAFPDGPRAGQRDGVPARAGGADED